MPPGSCVRNSSGGVECRRGITPARGVVTVNAPTRPKGEIARLGKEIYERDIRPKVEASHSGEYVAIDVETEDWAIADTDGEAFGAIAVAAPRCR